ncbi:MAG: hypothetical protein J6B85_03625 [Lachnospiraceae bacterium]|nr:hypothetical protein [Lachnospiraceae bacterium]
MNLQKVRELYQAHGIELEVHNLVVDYTLPDGSRAHVANQVIASGIPCTDEVMIQKVREGLPEGSRICGIVEIYGDYELKDLEVLSCSWDGMYVKKRAIYCDRELLKEYLREYAEEL